MVRDEISGTKVTKVIAAGDQIEVAPASCAVPRRGEWRTSSVGDRCWHHRSASRRGFARFHDGGGGDRTTAAQSIPGKEKSAP